MDIKSLLGTIMSADALSNIGSAAGADKKDVKNVLTAALPSLLGGIQAQSDDETTGFGDALLSHGKADLSDLSGFLGKVDLEDGAKIIGHLFGKGKDEEISKIADEAGVTKAGATSILSAAAPLVMSLFGQHASSSADDSSNPSALASVVSLLLKNADIGSLLGGLLSGDAKDDKDDKKSPLGD